MTDTSDSFDNDPDKKIALIAAIKERLYILENPVTINISKVVSDERRDKFYDSMHKYDPNDIISLFEKQQCPNTISYNFVCITDEKRKNQIEKLNNKITENESA